MCDNGLIFCGHFEPSLRNEQSRKESFLLPVIARNVTFIGQQGVSTLTSSRVERRQELIDNDREQYSIESTESS